MPTWIRQADDPRRATGEPAPRALPIAGLSLAAVLVLLHLVALLRAPSLNAMIPIACGLILGAALADFVAAFVHWACDTWGDERTPWIGDGLIKAFREHHRDPNAMLGHGFVEVNWQAASAAAVGLAAAAMPGSTSYLIHHPGLHAFLWSLLTVSAFANQLHAWAHMRTPPRAVRWLQRSGIVLSRREHAGHHHAPHTGDYCIAMGWLNRPLDRIGFWRRLEGLIQRATGATPRASTPQRTRPC